MIRKFIATAVLASGLALAPTPDADASRLMVNPPPCRYEDGSGQVRCFWDARHMGNGIGRSYIMTRVAGNEHQEFISHRKAHRLLKIWRRNNR